jgi:hypothetical protein
MNRMLNRAETLEAFAPEVDLPIDPGIREAVLILRRAGIETFESCEGGAGHAFDVPTIRFNGDAWAGYKAFGVAMENGLPVECIQRVHSVVNGQLEGPWWEIVFHTTG